MGNTPCCIAPKEEKLDASPIEAVEIAQAEKPAEEAVKSDQQTEAAAEIAEEPKAAEAEAKPDESPVVEPKVEEAETKPDESPVVEEIEKVEKEAEAVVAASSPEFYEWTVKIQKKEATDAWGIGVIPSLDKSMVTLTHGCPLLDEWNNSNKTKSVRRTDQIFSVNGATGTADKLIDEMKKCTDMEMVMRRKKKVVVEVTKTGTFGMSFANTTDMSIDKILPGIIKSYNDACAADDEIGPGDCVVEINGKATNLLEEAKACKEGDKVTLVFQRPSI